DAGQGRRARAEGDPDGVGAAAGDVRQGRRHARPDFRHAAPGGPDAVRGQRLDGRGARQPAGGDAGPARADGAGEEVSLVGAVRRGASQEGGEQVKHAVTALLLICTGCVGALKSEYPERRYYTLAAERPGA